MTPRGSLKQPMRNENKTDSVCTLHSIILLRILWAEQVLIDSMYFHMYLYAISSFVLQVKSPVTGLERQAHL